MAQTTIYANFAGEPMLTDVAGSGSGNDRYYYNQYDQQGRLILAADPSAVPGCNPATPGLVALTSLQNGLVQIYKYFGNADPGPAGYLWKTWRQEGNTTTQSQETDYAYSACPSNGSTFNLWEIASVTDAGSGTVTTYGYTWNSWQPATITTTTGADVTVEAFDHEGRLIATKDADGTVDYGGFDGQSGDLVASISNLKQGDIPTNVATDDQSLPWSCPRKRRIWTPNSIAHIRPTLLKRPIKHRTRLARRATVTLT